MAKTGFEILSQVGVDKDEIDVDESVLNSINPNDQTLDILNRSLPSNEGSLTAQSIGEAEPQKIRSALGGLTFQFADEIEAFAVSLLEDGVSYDQAKAEINKKVAAYAQQNPKEALAFELAGAVIPTVLSIFGGPGAWQASVGNLFKISRSVFKSGSHTSKLSPSQVMGRSGTSAGVYSVGASKDKTFGSVVGDFTTGFIIGAPIAGAFVLGGNVVSGISTYVSTLGKRMFGNTASLAVRKELQKLMEITGKTEDEVVVDLMNGRLMTENQTLVNLIKETIKGKGAATDIIEQIAKLRPHQTKTNVIDDLQKMSSGSGSDANLTKIWQQSQSQIRKKEKELYDTVFGKKGGNPNLVKGMGDGIVNDLLSAAQMKGTGVFEALEQIYSSSGSLVPLFAKNKDGVIRFLRQPSLEDAEVIRRALSEVSYDLFKSGKGTAGGNIKALEQAIRKKLDKLSPSLTAVREQAKVVRKGREAYEYGLGLLNAKKGNSAEDVQLFIEAFGDVPGVMNALRIGITQALKNKKGYQSIKEMADESTPLHNIMQQVLPENQLASIMAKLNVASNAAKVSPTLQGSFGSQTAEKIQWSRVAGASGGREGGIKVAISDGAIQYMKRKMGLSDKHAKEYAEIITTSPENYQKLEKALIDDSSMGLFMRTLDDIIMAMSQAGGDLRAKTGAADVKEAYNLSESSGIQGLMELAGDAAFPMITGFEEQ